MKVKRSESIVIDQPYSFTGSEKLKDARRVMAQHGVSGRLILNDRGQLNGILTARDILFEMLTEKRESQT